MFFFFLDEGDGSLVCSRGLSISIFAYYIWVVSFWIIYLNIFFDEFAISFGFSLFIYFTCIYTCIDYECLYFICSCMKSNMNLNDNQKFYNTKRGLVAK